MKKNQLWYSQHWLLLSVHRRDTRARVTRARGGGAVCGPCRPLIKTSVLMSIRRDQKMFTVATRTRQSAHINHTPINQVNRGARFWAFVLKEIIEHIKIKAKVKNWFICQSLKCELLHLSWIGSHPPGRHDITGTCRLNIGLIALLRSRDTKSHETNGQARWQEISTPHTVAWWLTRLFIGESRFLMEDTPKIKHIYSFMTPFLCFTKSCTCINERER